MDTLSPRERSERMSRVRQKHTSLELTVRKVAHRLGYRYSLHRVGLPGKPDLVFPSRRKVILVHGCFWHLHADPTCKLARLPKSRQEYWLPKLKANRAHDEWVVDELTRQGWKTLEIWGCQIKDNDRLERAIRQFLE
jgi:DNA mismatch endonuclease (patch repair protein)